MSVAAAEVLATLGCFAGVAALVRQMLFERALTRGRLETERLRRGLSNAMRATRGGPPVGS